MSETTPEKQPSLLLPMLGIAIISALIGAGIAQKKKSDAKAEAPAAAATSQPTVTQEADYEVIKSDEEGVVKEIVIKTGEVPEENGVVVYDKIADFAMETSLGDPISRETMMGTFWVADFIFTRCAGPCPAMTEQMKALQAELPDRDDLKLVTFTIDPDFDTPAILKNYAKKHSADPGRWLFARGTFYETQDFAKNSLKVGVDRDGAWVDPDEEEVVENPTEEQIESGNVQYKVTEFVHSQKFVLIDDKGRIRGYYDGTLGEAVSDIIADLNAILPESSTGDAAG